MMAGAAPPAMRGMITSAAFRLSDRNKRCTMVCCGGPNFSGECSARRPRIASAVRRGSAASQRSMFRAVRIENRWHSDALFIWLVHAPMDDAQLPQMHIIAEPLRERCRVRCRSRWTGCCRELARSGADARAELRLGVPYLGQQGHGIERAIKLSKTPFDAFAQLRMRQSARIGRGRNMIALDHFRALASLVLQLEGRLEEVGVQPRCGIQAFQHARRLDAIEATVSHKSPDDRAVLLLYESLIILLVGEIGRASFRE